ncbi:MAG: hypothetical protein J1G38_01110 [Clostridiales bacterium]|nr:hypothetical protein [Clostridiales bacterium]
MKTNIESTLNKLIAYARDNLLLDALDEVYTLNRLAALCGVAAVKLEETETDETLDALLTELKATKTDIDVEAVKDLLMPAPHTVDFYFRDELGRKPQKAFDFLFDLYECCGSVAGGNVGGENGYIHYCRGKNALARPVMLDVGMPVPYTPIASGNRVAALTCDDIFSADVIARLYAYAASYGGTIAKRVNSDGDYLACSDSAVAHAKTQKNVKDGAVKIDLLDYPVPALKFSGIGKNAVMREAAELIKAAAEADIACVAACACESGSPCLFVIFAGEVASDGVITSSDALTCCGVAATPDYAPLLPVLEKGTALSSDLYDFKQMYSEIGGTKLGAKAQAALDGAIAKHIKAALTAAASASETQATSLLNKE